MKPLILLVDDDAGIFEVLAELLTGEGFEVRWAQNAREFELHAFSSSKPDLILLDIMLGFQNGPEIYKYLLGKGFDRNVPVIFVSGLLQEDPQPLPSHSGRHYAMHSKPFEFNRLLSDIRNLTSAA